MFTAWKRTLGHKLRDAESQKLTRILKDAIVVVRCEVLPEKELVKIWMTSAVLYPGLLPLPHHPRQVGDIFGRRPGCPSRVGLQGRPVREKTEPHSQLTIGRTT